MIRKHSGFSLLQTSLLLMMAALVLVSLVPGQGAGDSNQKILDTVAKLNKVEDAMQRFMALNGRRPCPADGQYDVNNVYFGWEAGYMGSHNLAGTDCSSSTPSAPLGPDAGTGLIVGGMIPTKTLGLPDDYAFDSWGRRMTYEVDVRATSTASCFNLKTGGIKVVTEDPTGAQVFIDSVMYAYITHGPGGYGAWPAQGSSLANRINTGIADADKQNNAGVNSSFVYSPASFTNTLFSKDRTAQFDDVVYYIDAFKNTCCVGQACGLATGFIPQGASASDNAGSTVLTLDLNGDGLTDLAICAPNASPGGLSGAGAVYVVFGSKNALYNTGLPLTTLDGTNGVQITGANSGDHICSSLAAGDINDDNINDLLIGAPAVNSNTGAVYVVLGGIGAWPASFTVANLGLGPSNGINGWAINGESAGDLFGTAVAARDFNGDDFDDILVGAPGANNGGANDGAAYIFCGGTGPGSANVYASGLTGIPGYMPYCGFKINSPAGKGEHFGFSVAMGNLYGDNFADAIIGAPYGKVGSEVGAGKVYVICGGLDPYAPPVDATLLTGIPGPGGSCGTVFTGVDLNYNAGWSVASGDINGDGIMDLIIGAPNSSPLGRTNAGSTYVVYGSQLGFGPTFDLNSVTAATSGFRIDGLAGDHSGTSVYAGCDINGDGVQDVIIGAPNDSPLTRSNAGTVYAIFGATTHTSLVDVGTLTGLNGVAIYGPTASYLTGTSVASGDFYNFGLCSVIAGAPGATVGGNAGAGTAYIAPGTTTWSPTFDLGTLR